MWSSDPPRVGRVPSHNILTESRGISSGVKADIVEMAFRTFFNDEIVAEIVACTNREAERVLK